MGGGAIFGQMILKTRLQRYMSYAQMLLNQIKTRTDQFGQGNGPFIVEK